MNNPFGTANNHRKRATNLPGAAGGNFVPNRKRRSPPMLAAKPVVAAPVPTMPPTHDAPKRTTVAAVAQTSPSNGAEFQADLNALHDRMQWVYGTVAVDLVGTDDPSVIARVGERILLTYPMDTNAETGTVHMHMKVVDPQTAQLKCLPVKVYDGDSDTHCVTNFSLMP